jgi:MFS family permease
MIVSFLYIGSAIGAAVGGTLCDMSGRKKSILITDVLFIIGAISLFLSQSFIQLLIGRLIVGFAIAVSGIADVAYLHEISPIEWRGAIVSVNEACISLGFLVSYVTGYGISQLNEVNGWRYMFGLGSFIAVFQFVGMAIMPESPVWLEGKGRIEEAQAVTKMILGTDNGNGNSNGNKQAGRSNDNGIIEDYGLAQNEEKGDDSYQSPTPNTPTLTSPTTPEQAPHPTKSKKNQHGYRYPTMYEQRNYTSLNIQRPPSALSSPSSPSKSASTLPSTTEGTQQIGVIQEFRESYRQVIIAIFLSVMQQFCGHPNVLNFAPELFEQIGVASLFSTLLVGVLKFCITCFVIYKIENLGRRFLLLLGMSIIALSLLLISIAFSSQGLGGGDNDNDNDENMDYELSMVSKILAIIGIFGVAGGYACSFGPLCWLLVSELFPSSIRGRALGASSIVTSISAALVSYSFLSVQQMFGPSAPFIIYFILTVLSIGFVIVAIPDTAGKDTKTIQRELEGGWLWRRKEDNLETFKKIDSSHQVV